MTDAQARSLIEKLSRLTEARGATQAEALRAREKIRVLNDRLDLRPLGVYVEGWPGEVTCSHPVRYQFGTALVCGVCRKQILR